MGNPKLYTYCNVGTKRLIERYVEEVVRQLEFIAMGNHQSVTLADKIGMRVTSNKRKRAYIYYLAAFSYVFYHLNLCRVFPRYTTVVWSNGANVERWWWIR